MDELIFAFDDNLGLPNDFYDHIKLKSKPYHDLSIMLKDFEKGRMALLFTPVGTLPYLKSNYAVIAQATLGKARETKLETSLVTAEDVSLPEISNVALGRVNKFCTTSYWAPLVHFMATTKPGTSVKFIDTEGFQDMFAKTHAKKIKASMVWNKILERNKERAQSLQLLTKEGGLPTPVIIANINLPSSIIKNLTHFQSNDETSLFSGFTVPNLPVIHTFIKKMEAAAMHFNLNVDL